MDLDEPLRAKALRLKVEERKPMSEFTSPAFSQGREACKAGKRHTQNPYRHPPLRLAWAEGFAQRAQEEAAEARSESTSSEAKLSGSPLTP